MGEDLLIIETPNGRIQGKIELSQYSNKTYYAFYSVRYAEPPVGNLRFQVTLKICILTSSAKRISGCY